MKCLSLWQPWASLLVHGRKTIETRSWETEYTGPLLIHAAKRWKPPQGDVCLTEPFVTHLGELFAVPSCRPSYFTSAQRKREREGWGMPFGAVVGVVWLESCVRTDNVHDAKPDEKTGHFTGWWNGILGTHHFVSRTERAFGDYSDRRFAWVCKNPRPFAAPVPARGFQMLFDLDPKQIPGLADAVASALTGAA